MRPVLWVWVFKIYESNRLGYFPSLILFIYRLGKIAYFCLNFTCEKSVLHDTHEDKSMKVESRMYHIKICFWPGDLKLLVFYLLKSGQANNLPHSVCA